MNTPIMTDLAARCMANEKRRQDARRGTRRSHGRMSYEQRLNVIRARYAAERDGGHCPKCHKKVTDTYVYCAECRLKDKIRKSVF